MKTSIPTPASTALILVILITVLSWSTQSTWFGTLTLVLISHGNSCCVMVTSHIDMILLFFTLQKITFMSSNFPHILRIFYNLSMSVSSVLGTISITYAFEVPCAVLILSLRSAHSSETFRKSGRMHWRAILSRIPSESLVRGLILWRPVFSRCGHTGRRKGQLQR